MIRSRFFVGSVLSLILLGSSITLMSCDPKESIAKELEISVVLQETTAIVTATWSYTVDVSAWVMRDEWRSSRVSGGDDWNLSGNTMDGSATFTVPRSIASSATGAFCVTPVRINPQPGRFTERCADFVVPAQTIPDAEVDSIAIVVTDASTGQPIRFQDNAYIRFREVTEGGVIDTIWDYKVMYEGQEVYTLHATGRSSTGHGLQLTALAYKDGAVVGCNGDCRAFPPELHWEGCVIGVDCPEDIGMPWHEPDLRQAYNPFPPLIDVLGR
jgi:hypothetical protein